MDDRGDGVPTKGERGSERVSSEPKMVRTRVGVSTGVLRPEFSTDKSS